MGRACRHSFDPENLTEPIFKTWSKLTLVKARSECINIIRYLLSEKHTSDNSLTQDYSHLDNQVTKSTFTPGFKPHPVSVLILNTSRETQWPNGQCTGLWVRGFTFTCWLDHCVVFLGKAIYFCTASLPPGVLA